jgi:TonB family protein
MAGQCTTRRFGTSTRRWVQLLLAIVVLTTLVAAQNATPDRKIRSRVTPIYPELARKMSLVATVRVQVTIAPSGVVLQAKPLGGHPLLIEPSVEAAKKWRYEPGGGTSIATIEFHYSPGTD